MDLPWKFSSVPLGNQLHLFKQSIKRHVFILAKGAPDTERKPIPPMVL